MRGKRQRWYVLDNNINNPSEINDFSKTLTQHDS